MLCNIVDDAPQAWRERNTNPTSTPTLKLAMALPKRKPKKSLSIRADRGVLFRAGRAASRVGMTRNAYIERAIADKNEMILAQPVAAAEPLQKSA